MLRAHRIAIVLFGLLSAATAVAEPIVVVVDRDNPKTDITVEELKSFYTGKRHDWPDGARAVPIDLEAGSPIREAFQAAALRMKPAEYERWWVDQKVRGQGEAPRTTSAGTALKLVAKVRGAMAYVPASVADSSVKILTVNGIAAGSPGYALNAP